MKGSTTALELLVDLKPSFSAKFLDKVKEKVKKTLSTVGKALGLGGVKYYPATVEEMQIVINELDKKEIEKMKNSLADKLKSV